MALVWVVEHFAYFLRARQFGLYTDHKPLEVNFRIREPTSCLTSARIERWLLRIQEFDFRVKHILGKKMIADFLSRATSEKEGDPFDSDTEITVNSILEADGRALTEEDIKAASEKDPQIGEIRAAMTSDKWPHKLKRFELMK